MLHHELIQMIDNCAQAAKRNDRDALRSFPPEDKSEKREKLDSVFHAVMATVPPKYQAIAMLSNIAELINELETRVIPAMDPADLMKLQIELAGFNSSFLSPASLPTTTANAQN